MAAEVTLLLPQYRTLELTKLCLRLLRTHTDLSRVQLLVIDNGSGEGDPSLAWLRTLNWIRLIERPAVPGEPPAVSHARALDLGLSLTETPFVLSFHTDTLVLSGQWIDFLLEKIRRSENTAGVGSWKLEYVSPLKRFGKTLEDFCKRYLFFYCYGNRFGELSAHIHKQHYLRSHCALYRTELLKNRTRGFFDGETAGKSAHRMLTEAGFQMEFLPSRELFPYMRHLDHATMILNPEISGTKTETPAARRRLRRELEAMDYRAILADDSLDR